MSDIDSRVKAIIVDKLTVDENEVTPTAEFSKDLGADSLDTVELIMEFEKEFGITIPDEDAEKIDVLTYYRNSRFIKLSLCPILRKDKLIFIRK